jgi:hypothetical protein
LKRYNKVEIALALIGIVFFPGRNFLYTYGYIISILDINKNISKLKIKNGKTRLHKRLDDSTPSVWANELKIVDIDNTKI